MATLTVRLDAETKAALEDIRSATGMTITEVVKQGVRALRERVQANPHTATFYDFYRSLPPLAGGDAIAPARDSRRAVRKAIAQKLKRKRAQK